MKTRCIACGGIGRHKAFGYCAKPYGHDIHNLERKVGYLLGNGSRIAMGVDLHSYLMSYYADIIERLHTLRRMAGEAIALRESGRITDEEWYELVSVSPITK